MFVTRLLCPGQLVFFEYHSNLAIDLPPIVSADYLTVDDKFNSEGLQPLGILHDAQQRICMLGSRGRHELTTTPANRSLTFAALCPTYS
jgi:hypothetical protein